MDLKGIGTGFALVAFILILCSIVAGVAVSATLDDGTISSKTRIEPRIELIINNNQLDTLFVYEVK